jgi:uncharacterized protein involved in exopolysaccharide biosynthesis
VDKSNDFLTLVKAAWHHKYLIIIVALVAGIVSFLITGLLPKEYDAITVFSVEDDSAISQYQQMLGVAAGTLGNLIPSGNGQVGTYEEILKSRVFLQKALNSIGLNLSVAEIDELRKDHIEITIRKSGAIAICVSSRDPIYAQKVAQAMADYFVSEEQHYFRNSSLKKLDFLEDQTQKNLAELEMAEQRLTEMGNEFQSTRPEEQIEMALTKIARYEVLLGETKIAINEINVQLSELDEQLVDMEPTQEIQRTVTTNPIIRSLEQQLVSLEGELAEAQAKYTDAHPVVIEIKEKIESVKKLMSDQSEEVISARVEGANTVYRALMQSYLTLKAELSASLARVSKINEMIAEEEKKLVGLPEKELEYSRALRDAKVAEELYLLMLKDLESTRVVSESESGVIRIIEPAIVPYRHARPSRAINTVVAAFLAGLISVIWAYFRDVYGPAPSQFHKSKTFTA